VEKSHPTQGTFAMPHNTPKKWPTLLRIILREHGEKNKWALCCCIKNGEKWRVFILSSHPKLQSSRPTSQVLFSENHVVGKK